MFRILESTHNPFPARYLGEWITSGSCTINLSKKMITWKKVKGTGWKCVKFRRTLWRETEEQWNNLKILVDSVCLTDNPDRVRWKIGYLNTFKPENYTCSSNQLTWSISHSYGK
jgi:hypothetical protein